MLIAFIILWVLLGAAVFFLAMRGGPSGSRRVQQGESKGGRRLVTLGIVVVFAFGLIVPALVLASNARNKAAVGSGGVHLNAQQQTGRDLFARACAVCHTLQADKSVGRIGPNLDVRVGEDIGGSTPAEHAAKARALVLNAVAEGRARGLGQMPAQLYVGKEAEDVASFVAAVAAH